MSKLKGKRILTLGGCEHQQTVAVLDEPDESGHVRANVGTVVPVPDGQPLIPGEIYLHTSTDDDGHTRVDDEFQLPGGEGKTSSSIGWSRKYAASYDNIDWGSGSDDKTLN